MISLPSSGSGPVQVPLNGIGSDVGVGLVAGVGPGEEVLVGEGEGDAVGVGILTVTSNSASAAGLVVLPLAWDHYFMLLVPGLAALTVVLQDEGHLSRRPPAFLLAATFAALALPTPNFVLEQATALGLAGALLISHYFAGALGMLALALLALRRPPGATASAVGQPG